MSMETPQESALSTHHMTPTINGGKKKRPFSHLSLPMGTSASSSGGNTRKDGGDDGGGSVYFPSSSSEISSTTTTPEDEDMANCLILLAQGDCPITTVKEEVTNAVAAAADVTTVGCDKGGLYIYECKTCNRNFPSFQALGGHRASHKRPKATAAPVEEENSQMIKPVNHVTEGEEEIRKYFNKIINHQSPVYSNNKMKNFHECSICGSEFSSGQALGGHMRRHRSSPAISTIGPPHEGDQKTPGKILPLDLNLPAPEDDSLDSSFRFTAGLLRGPALVGCHF